MKHAAIVTLLSVGLATGCAANQHQLTNQQLAIGAAVVAGVALLVYLAVSQCQKGASFCDDQP